jgi:hypothetical protein
MKDGTPFGIAGIWENWKEPASGEWIRTFAVITADANEIAGRLYPLAERRSRSARVDASVPGKSDANVVHLNSRQQAGE